MPTTVQTIVDRCIISLSQVPGVSTQVYASDRLLQYVEDAFDLCFDEHSWSSYRSFWTGALNGTSGHLTSDIVPTTPISSPSTPIIDYKNILMAWSENSNRPVPEMSPQVNPDTISGGTAMYRIADYTFANRPIKFWPEASTGNVRLLVLQEPQHPFALTDTVYIDPMMLTYGACFLFAADDGTNPGQISKFQALFKQRVDKMIAADNAGAIRLDSRQYGDIDMWWELEP